MSHIAQALAKAKERTGHTTAPFMTPGGVLPPPGMDRSAASAAAIRQAQKRQRFWLVLALVSLPLTAFIFWTQARSLFASKPPADTTVPVAKPVAAAPATTPAVPVPVVAPVPRPEIAQAVSSLAISAVMPGDPVRIMLAGRVIRAGQSIDGGLTFRGIADGQLQFTDASGALYTRRY